MRYTTRKYNLIEFNFRKPLQKLFGTKDLSLLHEQLEVQYKELFKVGQDSSTVFHQKFYDKYHSGWPELENTYYRFIEKVVSENFNEDFLYQLFPTIRFHLIHNIAVGDFHNDSEFHHPDGEINFIIPLTDSDGTSSCWIESEPDKKDFEAMRMYVGELIMFDGNHLTHGNKINETGKTRVSLDFRILPLSKYNPNNEDGSMTLGTKFREGEYYKKYIKHV